MLDCCAAYGFLYLTPLELAFMLFVGHFLGDFSLQSEYMSTHKSPAVSKDWYIVMTAHCAVHAMIVFVLTGRLVFAIAEFVVHFATDYVKCKRLD
jgi:hypothetical protein